MVNICISKKKILTPQRLTTTLTTCLDLWVLLPNRELWRRRPVLLPLPAIPGAAQSGDLFAHRRLRPGAQHHLQLVILLSSQCPRQRYFWYWLSQETIVFQQLNQDLLHCEGFPACQG